VQQKEEDEGGEDEHGDGGPDYEVMLVLDEEIRYHEVGDVYFGEFSLNGYLDL